MDPRFDAAWKTFQQKVKSEPPHVAAAELRLFVDEELLERILRKHEEETTKIVILKEPPAIGRENAPLWYTGPQAGDVNWPRLKQRLLPKLGPEATEKIDQASDKVVAMLDHPGTPTFASRGLVVGHVQSGKTSNFTAVAAKAADRGYRLVIVFSGIHNALRRQTQARMIQDVVELNETGWLQVTALDHDFLPVPNPAALLSANDQCLLLVVKKNAAVLTKLRRWLAAAPEAAAHCPALVIDDEADQATVATKKINPLIQKVLKALPRHCYVGYTATPFANLLIDPTADDFYPKDFILSLPRGADYQGPETLFGRDPLEGEDPANVPGGLDLIRTVPEDEIPALRPTKAGDISTFVPSMTPSLVEATHWFWLATAARRVREGQPRHSSMLIHSHTNTRVHDSFEPVLKAHRRDVLAQLERDHPATWTKFEALWNSEQSKVPAKELGEQPVTFAQLRAVLPDTLRDTRVVLDHYRSSNRLDYTSGPVTVIAVGGNTLSRGLTLEGLVVSMFVRSSNVYDTLLQMGRWFGYRPGYSDMPRIYMPAGMRDWFAHLATVEAEVRVDIDRYITEHKTPLELAVRIRCHPKMRVTAPSRAGSQVRVAASYGEQLIETRYFPTAPEAEAEAWHRANAGAVERLLESVYASPGPAQASDGHVLVTGAPVDDVLQFLQAYSWHERSVEASRELMTRYVEKRVKSGGLQQWNVAVIGAAPRPGHPDVKLPDGSKVGSVVRSRTLANANSPVADIKTLTGSRDVAIDLAVPPGKPLSRRDMQSLRLKQQPERGLLLLYPIDARAQETADNRKPLDAPGELVWGAAIVFPRPSVGVDVDVDYNYVAADLSKVYPASAEEEGADEDLAILEEDQDTPDPLEPGEGAVSGGATRSTGAESTDAGAPSSAGGGAA